MEQSRLCGHIELGLREAGITAAISNIVCIAREQATVGANMIKEAVIVATGR